MVKRSPHLGEVKRCPARMKCQAQSDGSWCPGGQRGFGSHVKEFGLDPLRLWDWRVLEGRATWSYLHLRKIPGRNTKNRLEWTLQMTRRPGGSQG